MAKYLDDTGLAHLVGKLQPKLASGTNIKTINNQSLLGSGNITISAGSTKYRHNCTFVWDTGSGSNYRAGSLSFFFDDTNPQSYYDEDFDNSSILNFLKNHCGMADNKHTFLMATGGGQIGLETASPYRANEIYVISSIENNYGSWYCCCMYHAKTNSTSNVNIHYYTGSYLNFLPTSGVAILYDNVEVL